MIAIIRIHGRVKLKKEIVSTLDRLRLRKKYSCVVLNPTKAQTGMIKKLRDVVADMDVEMASFFAKGKRGSMYHGFELYDFVDDKDINRVKKFANKEIAFSFRNSRSKVYIALYKKINPLNIHIFSNFDIDKARGYADFFKEIDELVHVFR